MGLFSRKPTQAPLPVPMEERPVRVVRLEACKHSRETVLDGGCDCDRYGADLVKDKDILKVITPSRRGATKRTQVWLRPKNQYECALELTDGRVAGWAKVSTTDLHDIDSSDQYRLEYLAWLSVAHDNPEDEDDLDYDADVRVKDTSLRFLFALDDPRLWEK